MPLLKMSTQEGLLEYLASREDWKWAIRQQDSGHCKALSMQYNDRAGSKICIMDVCRLSSSLHEAALISGIRQPGKALQDHPMTIGKYRISCKLHLAERRYNDYVANIVIPSSGFPFAVLHSILLVHKWDRDLAFLNGARSRVTSQAQVLSA